MHCTERPTILRWIDVENVPATFDSQPFPSRGDRGSLGPLVHSIRRLGCLLPLIARSKGGKLQVVCGWRRLLALQALGQGRVPVLVRELDDDACRQIFRDENSQREPDLRALEPPSEAVARILEDSAREEAPLSELLELAVKRGVVDEESARTISAQFHRVEDQATELRRLVRERRGAEPQASIAGEATPLPMVPERALGTESLSPVAAIVDQPMSLLRLRLESWFRAIARSRSIPTEEIEAIATDLVAMAPIHKGRDVRSFSVGAGVDQLASHSLIVASLGAHLTEALHWTGGQVKKFTLACLLHDIGMLFVPRDLLHAERPFSAAERDQLSRHPEVGREIIQASRSWGAQIHLVAQDHHERWNGTGYPSGKRGKEVDLPARIVGFLDTYAALICVRPHRAAIPKSKALAFLAQQTGEGLHDPTVLLHFRSVFREFPVGSILHLDDGRLGSVVGFDAHDPRRFRLQLFEENGSKRSVGGSLWVDTSAANATEILPAFSVPAAASIAGTV